MALYALSLARSESPCAVTITHRSCSRRPTSLVSFPRTSGASKALHRTPSPPLPRQRCASAPVSCARNRVRRHCLALPLPANSVRLTLCRPVSRSHHCRGCLRWLRPPHCGASNAAPPGPAAVRGRRRRRRRGVETKAETRRGRPGVEGLDFPPAASLASLTLTTPFLVPQRPPWAVSALKRVGTLAGLTMVVLFIRLAQNKQHIEVCGLQRCSVRNPWRFVCSTQAYLVLPSPRWIRKQTPQTTLRASLCGR